MRYESRDLCMQPRQAVFFGAVTKSGSMLPDNEAVRHVVRRFWALSASVRNTRRCFVGCTLIG